MYTCQGKIEQATENALVAEYAPLVRRLALQMIAKLPASVEVDDLIQVGMMGLLDALRKYQDEGFKFETYAGQRIRGAMLDELRRNDWVPRGLRVSSRGVSVAIQAQEQKRGRPPTEEEIAQELKLPLESYQQLLMEIHGSQLVYREDFETEDGTNSLDSHIQTDGTLDDEPLNNLLKGEFRRLLAKAIADLPERERLLFSLCYEQEFNLREIGAVMEITQARVCQIQSQAINRLRSSLTGALKTLSNPL